MCSLRVVVASVVLFMLSACGGGSNTGGRDGALDDTGASDRAADVPATDVKVNADGGGLDVAQQCGVDGSRLLTALTTQEKAALCDCTAAMGGGYGQTRTCPDGGVLKTKPDQASCVSAQFKAGCTATVADSLLCLSSLLVDCSLASPDCAAYLTCVNLADAGAGN